MYSVKKNNIKLTRGDTFIAQVSILKDGEPYIPEPGDEIRFALKHPTMDTKRTRYMDEEPLIYKDIPFDTLVLRLDPEDTKPFPFGSYVYDIQITFANGVVDTFINGTLQLTEEVD